MALDTTKLLPVTNKEGKILYYIRPPKIKRITKKPSITIEEAFWLKVKKTHYCWIWETKQPNTNYATFYYNKKSYLAHHFSFYLAHGRFPNKDKIICHKCNNPPCVRPDHIYEGTTKDNAQDASKSGILEWGRKIKDRRYIRI